MAKKVNGVKKNTEEQPSEKSLEELILDYPVGKYTAIPMASIWAKELRRRDEFRHLTATEILEMALREVLEGKVDWKDLKKVVSANGENATGAGNDKAGKK